MKLLAFIFLREEITWLKFASMILIGLGTYLMIQKKETKEKAEDKKWQLYAVGSAVFASLTSILGKIGIQDVNSNLGTAIRTAAYSCRNISFADIKGYLPQLRIFT